MDPMAWDLQLSGRFFLLEVIGLTRCHCRRGLCRAFVTTTVKNPAAMDSTVGLFLNAFLFE